MNVVGAKERELGCSLVKHALSLYGIGEREAYGATACEALILGWGVLQSELGCYKRKLRVCQAMDGERSVLNNMLVGEVIALVQREDGTTGTPSGGMQRSSADTAWHRVQRRLTQVRL